MRWHLIRVRGLGLGDFYGVPSVVLGIRRFRRIDRARQDWLGLQRNSFQAIGPRHPPKRPVNKCWAKGCIGLRKGLDLAQGVRRSSVFLPGNLAQMSTGDLGVRLVQAF